MGETLELYCYQSAYHKVFDGPEFKYFITPLEGKSPIKVVHSLKEVAQSVDNLFLVDDKGKFLYDKLLLYASNDEDIKGKSKIIAKRNEVYVIGPPGSLDELIKIQEEMIRILNRKKK